MEPHRHRLPDGIVISVVDGDGPAGSGHGTELTGGQSSRSARGVAFARRTFVAASVYGLLLVLPLYGTEWMLTRSGHPLYDHPEFLYGFVGTTACMQLVYWTIGRDPLRFRPLMPIVALAKTSFFLPVAMLWLLGRTAGSVAFFACIDGLLAILFGHAWRITAPARRDRACNGERR